MGKVKGEEHFPNDQVMNRRRKKRKKELDKLRRNVLEAKRKLREKTAPPKTHTSSFNKILNSFADRRQANDNKTQGYDSKGRRAGLKKMCNRLLPSRKPQVGIFANGSKGAEIKRVNLSLNESDRARFEGDLQKVLGDGKRKCKESRSDAFNEILQRPSAEAIETKNERFIPISDEKLDRRPVRNFEAERQNGKRKMQMPVDPDKITAKRNHLEMENTKVMIQCTKTESEKKNFIDMKWKRSLFQDGEEDFADVSEPGVDQLRFSPTIDKAKATFNPSESKLFLDLPRERPGTKRLNFNYGQLGRMAATRYEELCAIVCAENFDTCLREIPHVDPLTQVKESLINFYGKTCYQKALRNEARPEMVLAEDTSSTSSHLVNSNIRENKYFGEDAYLDKSKPDKASVLPPRNVCPRPGISRKFSNRETAETSFRNSKLLLRKTSEVIKSKNISRPTRGTPSSEKNINEHNTSSLDVNYDSSTKSLRSDINEFLEINERAGKSMTNLGEPSISRLAGIPSVRKKIMIRYLKEVNNLETSNFPTQVSAVSAESDGLQKCYLNEPLRKREMAIKRRGNTPQKKVDEMRGPLPSETSGVEPTVNPLDVNRDSKRTCLGLDLGEFWKIDKRVKQEVVNLGSATSSTLAGIPSDRGEILLRYLEDVNNPEPRKEDERIFSREVFLFVPENDKVKKRRLQAEDTLANRPSKNGRHVPAILRKSQTTKKNNSHNTTGDVLASGMFGIGEDMWKNSSSNFEKSSVGSQVGSVNSNNSLFDRKQIPRKPLPPANPFPLTIKRSKSPEEFKRRVTPVETPSIINALYNRNEKALKAKRSFTDVGFSSGFAIGHQNNVSNGCRGVNFPEDVQQPSNFRNNRNGSENLPIFQHQQRRDSGVQRVGVCVEKRMASLGNQDTQRFPVFLKRKINSSTDGVTRYQGQHEARLFRDSEEPNVIIIQNPSPQKMDDGVRRKVNIPDVPYKNEPGYLKSNVGAMKLKKFPTSVQLTSMRPVQLENGREKMQFTVPRAAHNIVGQQADKMQIPRCGYQTDLQNVKHRQLPRIMYQNENRRVGNDKHTVLELGNNHMSFIEPRTLDVTTCQRFFHQDNVLSPNTEMRASRESFYHTGNRNLEMQHNDSKSEEVHFFDRRVRFVLPKNESESYCQTAINLPINNEQMSRRQNYGQVLSEEENCNYEYIIDPQCPQAGHKWNQIDQSGAQVHQHIIQPVYNMTDGYRPQVPHDY